MVALSAVSKDAHLAQQSERSWVESTVVLWVDTWELPKANKLDALMVAMKDQMKAVNSACRKAEQWADQWKDER